MSNMIQNDEGNKNEAEMLDMTQHLSPATHSISSDQPNDQMVDDHINIKAMLRDSQHPLSKKYCCIYKVPPLMRRRNEGAYTPTVVSIGPYHYGNSELQNMERYKHVFFKRFIQRVDQERLDDLINFVTSSELRVRSCYSHSIKLNKEEFVEMILLDASFIIELFQWIKLYDGDDSIWYQPWLMNNITSDLLLLENQLPFFILQELFNWVFPAHIHLDRLSFLKLTFNFFHYFNKQELAPYPTFTINHFTDLLRTFHLQKQKSKRERRSERSYTYCANDLLEAGVKFKVSSNWLLDLKFSRDVLEIPKIAVDNTTEALYGNMIALEQCHYPFDSYISDYVIVLGWLMNTSKDVDVMVHHEIISNYLGDSNDVAKLFTNLRKNSLIVNFNSDYLKICEELCKFYKDPRKNMKATLIRDYFKTPWQTAASIAGIILLILTLVQTVFSILQVVK